MRYNRDCTDEEKRVDAKRMIIGSDMVSLDASNLLDYGFLYS